MTENDEMLNGERVSLARRRVGCLMVLGQPIQLAVPLGKCGCMVCPWMEMKCQQHCPLDKGKAAGSV